MVSIRKQLGEEHKDYKQSLNILNKYKVERLTQSHAASRITRLWRALSAKRKNGGADESDAPEDASSEDATASPPRSTGQPGAAETSLPAGQGDAGAPQAMPPSVPQPPSMPQMGQQQWAQQWAQPPQPPPVYYPPPPAPAPAPAPAAPPQQALDFISSMASRVESLEGRADAASEVARATLATPLADFPSLTIAALLLQRILTIVEKHHAEMAAMRAAETERVTTQLAEEKAERERLREEMQSMAMQHGEERFISEHRWLLAAGVAVAAVGAVGAAELFARRRT